MGDLWVGLWSLLSHDFHRLGGAAVDGLTTYLIMNLTSYIEAFSG